MVVGVGIDIVEVSRVRNAAMKWEDTFLYRVFTARELSDVSGQVVMYQRLSARFAAKEAVRKAFGGLADEIGAWTDIEVRNEPSGRPVIRLYGDIEEVRKQRNIRDVIVSYAHTSTHAVASATLVGQGS